MGILEKGITTMTGVDKFRTGPSQRGKGRLHGNFLFWFDFGGSTEKYGDRKSDVCDRAGRSDSGTSGNSVDDLKAGVQH